jgi:PelA/Pel-15E family pectate lyase
MPKTALPAACLVLAAATLSAAVVGTSVAAPSLTSERIAALPAAQRSAWKSYLERSERQRQADRAFLAAELKAAGLAEPLTPPSANSARGMPLDRPIEWYAGADARRIAHIVVSFQTPAGGWSKNLDLTSHPRRPGEHFAGDNLSHYLAPGDFDTPHDPKWNYVGTLDNNATNTELQFLARVAAAADPKDAAAYRASFLRGVAYLLAAQFPNGGWPQVWPLEGGYHDAVTFNDGAVVETLRVLRGVAGGEGIFAFVPMNIRKQAAAAVVRGIDCILAAQIVESGRRTVWGQQHDALTLAPVAGRNYEPAALCAAESAELARFLMELPYPNTRVVRAIEDAMAWFRKTAVRDRKYERGPEGGRLAPAANAPLLWARFYQIGSDRPIFGDRDQKIYEAAEEISVERRRGYSWYGSGPQAALDAYDKWPGRDTTRDPARRQY